MKRLENKVAVVTGASKGIGAAIAKSLAAEGAKVVVNYSSAAADAEKVVAEIVNNGGTAIAVQANVAKETDIEKLFEATVNHYSGVDILVNNAGIYKWGSLEEVTEDGFHSQFNINVLGLLLASKAAANHFSATGGSIINIGSAVSTVTPAGSAIYTATKSAVDAITSVLSKELGSRRIRVNSVNPGMVETEGSIAAGFIGSEFADALVKQTPLQRMGQPDDIAQVVTFLASEESSWLTGEILLASGGAR